MHDRENTTNTQEHNRESIKDRSSQSTTCSHSSKLLLCLDCQFNQLESLESRQETSRSQAVSEKILRKLIDWLMNVCWNYNIDE